LRRSLAFESDTWQGSAKVLLILSNSHEPVHLSKEDDQSNSEDVFQESRTPSNGKENLNEIAGMALYYNNYSSWNAQPGVFLEDLFIRPKFRGRGYGIALLNALAAETLRIGGKRLDWTASGWNQSSIEFYTSKAVGAKRLNEKIWMRVEGSQLTQLAGRNNPRYEHEHEHES
jgi:GNAT superfamily N-acetyltransferase